MEDCRTSNQTCIHEGQCTDPLDGTGVYTCLCTSMYMGKYCEDEKPGIDQDMMALTIALPIMAAAVLVLIIAAIFYCVRKNCLGMGPEKPMQPMQPMRPVQQPQMVMMGGQQPMNGARQPQPGQPMYRQQQLQPGQQMYRQPQQQPAQQPVIIYDDTQGQPIYGGGAAPATSVRNGTGTIRNGTGTVRITNLDNGNELPQYSGTPKRNWGTMGRNYGDSMQSIIFEEY